MNLLKNILFSFLRIEMITSSFRICRKIIVLNIHEFFDIFELFENFWILKMSKSRSMWSLIFLKICDDCMLFRCSRTFWKTCLILILKSTAMTLSNFFENLFNRFSILFLNTFFATMMFVINWRVYDIFFSKRSWIFANSDWKKNFFVIVSNDLQKIWTYVFEIFLKKKAFICALKRWTCVRNWLQCSYDDEFDTISSNADHWDFEIMTTSLIYEICWNKLNNWIDVDKLKSMKR